MGTNLSQSLLQNTAFLGCNLRYASLSGSKLKAVEFNGCSLEEADLSEGKFKSVEFSDCDLRKSCSTPLLTESTCAAAKSAD